MSMIGRLFIINILLICAILYSSGYRLDNCRDRLAADCIRHMMAGDIGAGFGWAGNELDLRRCGPGDILLGGNDGATYGRYSHAALAVDSRTCWEVSLETGIRQVPVKRFLNYDRACILRVKASEPQRKQALRYVAESNHGMFYPMAFKNGTRLQNCTKFIWQAYIKQGIDLDERNDLWLPPDWLYQNRNTTVIAEAGK